MKIQMKKTVILITILFVTGMIIATGFGNISEAEEKEEADVQQVINLIIDDKQIDFSPEDGLGMPFIQYERTLVPLRKPLEAIGAIVNYDAVNRMVVIKKENTEITIVVDGGMLVNGSPYQVDAPAMIKDERVYVPIRHVFEVLGYSLSWNTETKTVLVQKTGSPIETVQGWSVPSYVVGSTGLGISDYIGVITEFPSYSKYNNSVRLNDPDQINELNSVGIGLRNLSEEKTVWLDSLTFEYQVFKKVNEKEALVYQKSFLPFEGTLPAQTGTGTELKINFWNPKMTEPGEYTIKLAHPEFFTGIDKETKEKIKISINDNIFKETVNITVD